MWKKAARAACRQALRLSRFAQVHRLDCEMIIACPACATRYVVPDSAIGFEGRTVRCAKCKHSWFQDGPEMAEPITAAYASPARQESEGEGPSGVAVASARPVAPSPQPTQAQDSGAIVAPHGAVDFASHSNPDTPQGLAPDRNFPAFDERAPVDRSTERPTAAADPEGEVSQFEHGPPFRPRRNWLRWMSWGAGAFAVLALAAVAAMSVLGVPSWFPIEKPLFGADPGLTVEFPESEQERRTLPNGAEFFGARVVVKNDARETRPVPPLLIVLRDARERVVYSWELVPPQRSLAPGEAMTINEAMTDVPKSAVYADIGWAPR